NQQEKQAMVLVIVFFTGLALVLNTEYKHDLNKILIHVSRTDIEKVPWQVSLQIKRSHICSGSIYKEYFVITAAHCVFGRKPEAFQIRAGSSTTVSGGIFLNVTSIRSHEDYKIHSIEHDIAIMRLSKPFRPKDHISLAETNPLPAVGTLGLVTGWGNITDYFGQPNTITSILHGTYVPILPQSSCKKLSWFNFGNICAGMTGTTTCGGDSGGALVVNKQVVGVVSAGTTECDTATTYASVPFYHQWILEAI
ncbi:hypothetical protein KR074_009274, partial [Drosophila pseudoananassae]